MTTRAARPSVEPLSAPSSTPRARRGVPLPRPVPRPVGRPRSGTADRAILDAAMALLAEVGLGGLTMSAVVSRSRVARATVYRRYPSREALIAAALAQVKGREPFEISGDLADGHRHRGRVDRGRPRTSRRSSGSCRCSSARRSAARRRRAT